MAIKVQHIVIQDNKVTATNNVKVDAFDPDVLLAATKSSIPNSVAIEKQTISCEYDDQLVLFVKQAYVK